MHPAFIRGFDLPGFCAFSRQILGQDHALPPEARVAKTLPEPAVLQLIEVPPLDVAVNEEDVASGGPIAALEMIGSVIHLPARPAPASRFCKVRLKPV